MKYHILRKLFVFVCTAAIFLLSVFAASNGVGKLENITSRSVVPGVTYQQSKAVDGEKIRIINQLEFNINRSDYMVLPWFGTDLYSRHTLTQMAEDAQYRGYSIVGGINGDFFNVDGTVTGMPVGVVIRDGRIICSEDVPPNIGQDKQDSWQTIGFKKDGTAVLDKLTFTKTLTIVKEDGTQSTMEFALFNRNVTGAGLNVFTEDFGLSTKTPEYPAVVLRILQGEFRINETVVCTVEKIDTLADIPLEKGKVVICAPYSYENEAMVDEIRATLKIGMRVDLKMSAASEWNGVWHAISGPDAVLSGGTVTGNPFIKPTNYPSSLVGIKPDGSIVMVQIDGRGSGGSYGIGAIQAGQYMKSLGCTDALLFDGGGSSEIIAQSDGNFTVLNQPSDGSERKIGTCLLIAEKSDAFLNQPVIKPLPPYPSVTSKPADHAAQMIPSCFDHQSTFSSAAQSRITHFETGNVVSEAIENSVSRENDMIGETDCDSVTSTVDTQFAESVFGTMIWVIIGIVFAGIGMIGWLIWRKRDFKSH